MNYSAANAEDGTLRPIPVALVVALVVAWIAALANSLTKNLMLRLWAFYLKGSWFTSGVRADCGGEGPR